MAKKIPSKRNGYYYIRDEEYVSITKVLGDVLAKPALYYWFKQQAARIALKHPELNEREVIAKMELNMAKSTERGHYVHSIAEVYPNVDMDKIKPQYKYYVDALVDWWKMANPKVVANEVNLYTDMFMVAGRCDKICIINNQTYIIDFKTGKDLYKEVGLQLAIYKFMANEMDMGIDKTAAVLLLEDGTYKFCPTNDSIEDFLSVLDIWRWLNKKGE